MPTGKLDPVPGNDDNDAENPAVRFVDEWVQRYSTMWGRYAATANSVWSDVTRSDADVGTWAAGYSKLMHTWSDNWRELWRAAGSPGTLATASSGAATGQVPVLCFVLDKAAQSSAAAQRISLPSNLSQKLQHTPFTGGPVLAPAASRSVTGDAPTANAPVDAPEPANVASLQFASVTDSDAHVAVSVTSVTGTADAKTGVYSSVVYYDEGTSNSSVPCALVLLTFR